MVLQTTITHLRNTIKVYKNKVIKINLIELNGNDFKTKREFHEILKTQLELPNYYGYNLDALWDCITTDVNLPIKIIWNNFFKSKEYLGDYCDSAAELLLKACAYHNGEFLFIIKN